MDAFISAGPISPLRQRLIDDTTMREFSRSTQNATIRDVGRFATFLARRKAGRQQGVMHPEGWLFPGLHAGKPISTRQLHRIVVEAARAADIAKRA